MYDIVIVSHNKDFNKIKYVVEYAEKNLSDFESIHLILTSKTIDEIDLIKSKTSREIFVHYEQDVLQLDFEKVNYRPNWIYQILLKMFQDVTKNDNFLILESDGIVNTKLSFFENEKTILYLGLAHSYHSPYFKFNDMVNIKKKYPHSLISEVMMYDKKIIKEMLNNCGCESREDFIEKYIYNNMTNTCYPADYEMYGNYLFNYHPDEILFKNYNYSLNGLHRELSDFEIQDIINHSKKYDYISFHTWI